MKPQLWQVDKGTTLKNVHTGRTEELNHASDWLPFQVLEGGVVVTHLDLDPPEVYNDDEEDIVIDDHTGDWEALRNRSQQYSYHGAIMHPSEQLAGRLALDILDTPGLYALVEVRDDTTLEFADSPIGWVILRKEY